MGRVLPTAQHFLAGHVYVVEYLRNGLVRAQGVIKGAMQADGNISRQTGRAHSWVPVVTFPKYAYINSSSYT